VTGGALCYPLAVGRVWHEKARGGSPPD
jgi:hypothetical protein